MVDIRKLAKLLANNDVVAASVAPEYRSNALRVSTGSKELMRAAQELAGPAYRTQPFRNGFYIYKTA